MLQRITMSNLPITIPSDFGYVLLGLTATGLAVWSAHMHVGGMRKECGVEYPTLYVRFDECVILGAACVVLAAFEIAR
jgi:hypothetical protein